MVLKKYGIYFCFILTSCALVKVVKNSANESMQEASFKTTLPIKIGKHIYIETYWGQLKKKKFLILDSGASFTTADSTTAFDTELCVSLAKTAFDAKTPDGKKLASNYFSSSKIQVGTTSFNNVTVLKVKMPNWIEPINNEKLLPTGLLGANMLSKGIWKINFKDSTLTFASSIDSIGDLSKINRIPLNKNKILKSLNVKFKKDINVELTIDLGFSGEVAFQKKIFDQIDIDKRATIKDTLISTVSGSSKILRKTLEGELILINNKQYNAKLMTNEIITHNLLGLGFFKKFDFIVLDYLNNQLYLSN